MKVLKLFFLFLKKRPISDKLIGRFAKLKSSFFL